VGPSHAGSNVWVTKLDTVGLQDKSYTVFQVRFENKYSKITWQFRSQVTSSKIRNEIL